MTLASCKDDSASYYDDSAIYQHSLALKRMTINRDLSTGTALPFTFTTLQYLLQGQLCQLHTRMTLIPIGTDLLSTHYLAATRMPEGIAPTSTRTTLPFTLTTRCPDKTSGDKKSGDKTSGNKTSVDKTSVGTKRPWGQNIRSDKTSVGQNVHGDKRSVGQNVLEDKTSVRTKCPWGQNVRLRHLYQGLGRQNFY
jgi:hypothetical protein